MTAIEHTYRYPQPSSFDATAGRLKLAVMSVGDQPHPCFFRGKLTQPKRAAQMLRALTDVVQARFHIPAAMLARIALQSDPVVTCSDEVLRSHFAVG